MKSSLKYSIFVAVCLVGACVSAVGQTVDYNKIILPADAKDVSFEEKLVQLAWRNNPETRISTHGVNIAREDMKVVTRNWSQLVGVQGNLNEFTIKQLTGSDVGGQLFFPRYNVFLQLPLSIFLQNPSNKRNANYKVEIAEENVKLLKLEIRTRVLKLYSDYKMQEEILTVRQQAMDDENSTYLLAEQKFRNGEISLDEYNRAQRNRNEVKIQRIMAESQFRKAKFDLEGVIGIRMEDVR